MASPVNVQRTLKQTETDIAVLQIQFKNLDEKVDDLKVDMKDMRVEIQEQTNSTHVLLKGFQHTNVNAHNEMATKISSLEKWRWMLMGAGIVIGALGWPAIEKILGI
jgi:hypothetical protein